MCEMVGVHVGAQMSGNGHNSRPGALCMEIHKPLTPIHSSIKIKCKDDFKKVSDAYHWSWWEWCGTMADVFPLLPTEARMGLRALNNMNWEVKWNLTCHDGIRTCTCRKNGCKSSVRQIRPWVGPCCNCRLGCSVEAVMTWQHLIGYPIWKLT